MLKYLPRFIRYAWISMSFSSFYIMYYISRTNTSVLIVRTRIFLYPLLIKFNVFHKALVCFFSFLWTKQNRYVQLWAGWWRSWWCFSICCSHNLITLAKFVQFQRQIFVQFIFVLVVFEETFSYSVRDFSKIFFILLKVIFREIDTLLTTSWSDTKVSVFL